MWYSLFILINNAYKHKIFPRVYSLYNDLHNNANNNELPRSYYFMQNHHNVVEYRYKYDNATKEQIDNELYQIKINLQKKQWLDTLLDSNISIQQKITLLKQYDIEIDTIRSFNIFSSNLFLNTDFEWNDFQ